LTTELQKFARTAENPQNHWQSLWNWFK